MANVRKVKLDTKQKAEMQVEITHTEHGKNYTFRLRGNHVEVLGFGQNMAAGAGWFEQLTDAEKLSVFNEILAEYRQRSMGSGGLKVAALGVTEDGRIYISENSEQLSDDYHRQCAEQTMVTISAQREVYNQISQAAVTPAQGETPVARYPTYKAVYLMGGRDNGKPPVICPCGNCTDLLAKVMSPGSKVWMLPVNNGQLELGINTEAKHADALAAGEAWCVPIEYLNKDREIVLTDEPANVQREAFHAMAARLSQRFMDERDGVSSPKNVNRLDQLEKKARTMASDKVNALQLVQIEEVLFGHLHELMAHDGVNDISPAGIEALLSAHVKHVRAAALQLDSGKVVTSIQASTSLSSALPPVEVTALGSAGQYIGGNGVAKVQVMEFNPEAILRGVQRTSPKQAIERLVKNRSVYSQTVDLSYPLFNNGDMSLRALESVTRTYDAKDLYPGYFIGKGAGRKPSLPQGMENSPKTLER